MAKHILYSILVLIVLAFVHYELSIERNLRLKLFCVTPYAVEKVSFYSPDCYSFMKTAF